MKKIIAILAVGAFLMTSGLALAKDYELTKKAGDYNVQIKIDKNPPVTGNNQITIVLQDLKGIAVKDATVAIDYGMPAMSGMGAMNYKTGTILKGDSYLATINFSMSGPWFINIKISRGGKTQTVKLNVDIK